MTAFQSGPSNRMTADDPDRRAVAVREMFSAIAPRYDLLNHLLSLNVDRRWRRRAIDVLGWDRAPAGFYLDSCAGTFDLGLELADRPGFHGSVAAIDFAAAMLRTGREKVRGRPVYPVCGDALRLPVGAERFDGAMVAFGVRNLADIDAGLRELCRALRPGARLVVLDFATPRRQPLRGLYLLYFTRILPRIGRLVSKHSYAYSYLPESVLGFGDPPVLAERMGSAGFADVDWQPLTGGIACIWTGRKPGSGGTG